LLRRRPLRKSEHIAAEKAVEEHVRFGSDLEYILQVVVPSRPAAVYLLLVSILVFFGMRVALPPRKLTTAGQAEIRSKKSISMVVPRKARHYCQPPCKDRASL
jgi:hypothetical protein